jgi:Arc/MetJ-type ribon-helix-helix transcriptional regulator
MTISVVISEAAKAHAEALVSSGRYESLEEAVEAAIWQLEDWEDEEVDLDSLSAEHRAAVEEGLADIEAGRVVDGETFFAELIAKYEAMAKAKGV